MCPSINFCILVLFPGFFRSSEVLRSHWGTIICGEKEGKCYSAVISLSVYHPFYSHLQNTRTGTRRTATLFLKSTLHGAVVSLTLLGTDLRHGFHVPFESLFLPLNFYLASIPCTHRHPPAPTYSHPAIKSFCSAFYKITVRTLFSESWELKGGRNHNFTHC